MSDEVKLIIEIPKKTIAHIRSDYDHGYKGLYDEDRDKIVDAIYHGTPLDDVKAEISGLSGFYSQVTGVSEMNTVRNVISDVNNIIDKTFSRYKR